MTAQIREEGKSSVVETYAATREKKHPTIKWTLKKYYAINEGKEKKWEKFSGSKRRCRVTIKIAP